MAENLRARFVRGAALQRVGRLAEHEIDAPAQAAARGDIRRPFDDEANLIEVEAAARDVVGVKLIGAACRIVEVVTEVAVQIQVDGGSGRDGLRRLFGRWSWRGRSGCGAGLERG